MLQEALGYPLAGERADEALVGGWVLYLLAGVVPLVPLVPLLGYYVRVLGTSARRESGPPDIANPGGLILQGLVGTLVVSLYLAVPLAISLGTAGGLVQAPQPDSLLDVLVVYAGGTLTLLVTVLFGYLLPAALAAYGFTGSVRSAVDRYALKRAATHAAYFYRWWVGFVLLALGISLGGWLWRLHPVARVLAPLPVVYLQLVSCHVWGVGFGAASRDYLAGEGSGAGDADEVVEATRAGAE